jgi:hypothetical protein
VHTTFPYDPSMEEDEPSGQAVHCQLDGQAFRRPEC